MYKGERLAKIKMPFSIFQ